MSLAEQRTPLIEMSATTLCLLIDPVVIKNGSRIEVPEASKRHLALVTLNGGRVSRRHAAGTQWPYGDDERGAGNLRSALWRPRRAGIDVLHADKWMFYLDPKLSVDMTRVSRCATRIIECTADVSDLGTLKLNPEALDLLFGWYDEWVIFERGRVRQRLLHAIESVVRRLISHRLFADAIELALTAVSVGPLRERAQRVLIEAHLAECNSVEAGRAYLAYSEIADLRGSVNFGLGGIPNSFITKSQCAAKT